MDLEVNEIWQEGANLQVRTKNKSTGLFRVFSFPISFAEDDKWKVEIGRILREEKDAALIDLTALKVANEGKKLKLPKKKKPTQTKFEASKQVGESYNVEA